MPVQSVFATDGISASGEISIGFAISTSTAAGAPVATVPEDRAKRMRAAVAATTSVPAFYVSEIGNGTSDGTINCTPATAATAISAVAAAGNQPAIAGKQTAASASMPRVSPITSTCAQN